jgi:exosortase
VKERTRFWITISLLAIVCAGAWKTLRSLFELAFDKPEYSHILLVLPVVLAFVFLGDKSEKATALPRPILAAVFAIAAVVVWLVVLFMPVAIECDLTLRVSAVVLTVWAIVGLLYGWDSFRKALFPMLFLVLLIPWPPIVVTKLTLALQSGSASAAYRLFRIFRVPVTRSGFLLSLPSMDIEVAKECSGIRSTVLLFLASLVLGQWYLRSAWGKTVLALAVFPFGILRNGLRIFVLSVLGTYVNENWLEGNLHHRGGALFFVLGLVLIVLLLWLLRQTEEASSSFRSTRARDSRLATGFERGKV